MLYSKKKRVVCFLACGSGGHVFPMISCAEELSKRNDKCILITDERGLQQLKNNGESSLALFDEIICEKAHYKIRISMIVDIIKSINKIKNVYSKHKVDAVFGFGSYIGLIGVIIARFMKIKSFIYESNAVFGFANKIAGFFSNTVFFNFKETKIPLYLSSKSVQTGHPLRESIHKIILNQHEKMNHHKDLYKIYDKMNILILGGSQGSSFLSETVSKGLCLLDIDTRESINIFHQARPEDMQKLKNRYSLNDFNSYEVKSFFPEISRLMTKTHICISRAGASTISELIAIGVPSILIPIHKSKNNHQLINAKLASRMANFLTLEQQELSGEKLANILTSLIEDNDIICQMHYQAKKNSTPNAHLAISDYIEFYLSR